MRHAENVRFCTENVKRREKNDDDCKGEEEEEDGVPMIQF